MIAFSTNEASREPHDSARTTQQITLLRNDAMSPLFMATIEATEEAIINSMFHAQSMTGRDGHKVDALPVEQVLRIMKDNGRKIPR